MAEAILDALGPVLTRWTMGAAAAPVATVWRDLIGSDPGEAELRLLALSGQFLGVGITADPPRELATLPDVPRLILPPLADPHRPLARRLLQTIRDGRQRGELLRFLARRGRTMHPADWMPTPSDEEAPELYAPWRDWAEAAAARRPAACATDVLTTENWEDWGTASRNLALAQLRRRDPAAARELIEARFASEGADARLRLIGLLADRLSDGDRPLLEAIATGDRAPKVKALAAALLARLGQGASGVEDAPELAAFFDIRAKGLLRRTRMIVPAALKTPAQHQRRRALLAEIPVSAFAAALQLAPEALPAMWSWHEDAQADAGFAAMAERSGSDALITDICAQLEDAYARAGPIVQALLPRLDDGRRTGFAQRLLRQGADFQTALAIGGGGCGIDGAIDLPAGAVLLHALVDPQAAGRDATAAELQALGLIASRAAARQAMERFAAAGLAGADPRLDMVRLNAALDGEEAKG